MSQKKKPEIKALDRVNGKGAKFFMPDSMTEKWQPEFQAAENSDDSTINIYSIIGEDYWSGEGMTAKIVSGVLRRNQGKDITVNINSPGGDFFEGVTIYNLLREHDGDVKVRIVGMAASAASVIAMAGDEILIAESGFLMIHNAWNICMGNRVDMRAMADTLEQFDAAMAAVYAKQSGMGEKELAKMMDKESWIAGVEAVEMGLATGLLDSDDVVVDETGKAQYNAALKKVDKALAQAGTPRSERRHLIKELTSTPGAAVDEPVTPGADEKLAEALKALTKTLTT